MIFKHGGDIPGSPEDVERFWEDVIVDQASVDRKYSHHQQHVSTSVHGTKHLEKEIVGSKLIAQCKRDLQQEELSYTFQHGKSIQATF